MDPRNRRLAATTAAVTGVSALVIAMLTGSPALADSAPREATVRASGGSTAVDGSYIVVLKDSALSVRGIVRASVRDLASQLTERHGGTVRRSFGAGLPAFEAAMTERQARRVAAEPNVAFVEQNHVVRAADAQPNPPSYGLDRIDQPALPLDQRYSFPNRGDGVTAYVIDSGVRTTHEDFGGRAVSGFDAVDGGPADDCNGHGTHVAGTIGGTRHGVAKNVELVAVRVLNCDGRGTFADVVDGVTYVTDNAVRPAVANMSLSAGDSLAVQEAVERSIAAGITYVVAAGNFASDACEFSPARVADAITVGASDRSDHRAVDFSNFGTCLDVFAPGVDIVSADIDSDTAVRSEDGTSMAAPHAAGVAALILHANPQASPQVVSQRINGAAAKDVVREAGSGSPNLLLQVTR